MFDILIMAYLVFVAIVAGMVLARYVRRRLAIRQEIQDHLDWVAGQPRIIDISLTDYDKMGRPEPHVLYAVSATEDEYKKVMAI